MFTYNYIRSLFIPDPLTRPLDQAISQHKKLLAKWNHKQQREILVALINEVFPAHHVHANPNTRKAA
jgi:hypothetical protein